MTNDISHESRIDGLFRQLSGFREYLASLNSIAKDGQDRTIIVGLSADQTLEFLSLYVNRPDHSSTERDRFVRLLDQVEAARIGSVAQDVNDRLGGRVRH